MRSLPAWILLLLAAAPAAAEDWPQWRGPRLDGHSAEKPATTRWSATDNIAWKTPIPGIGHSSPMTSCDRVFLTTALLKEQERVLLCLDRKDGKVNATRRDRRRGKGGKESGGRKPNGSLPPLRFF